MVLKTFIGLLMLVVGIVRIFLTKQQKQKELRDMNLPNYFDYLIILFEIIIGLMLILLNNKNTYYLYLVLLMFMIIATILILKNNHKNIKKDFWDMFTYQPTSFSVFLHITYIIIIISLL
jgi:hypothetical protein